MSNLYSELQEVKIAFTSGKHPDLKTGCLVIKAGSKLLDKNYKESNTLGNWGDALVEDFLKVICKDTGVNVTNWDSYYNLYLTIEVDAVNKIAPAQNKLQKFVDKHFQAGQPKAR